MYNYYNIMYTMRYNIIIILPSALSLFISPGYNKAEPNLPYASVPFKAIGGHSSFNPQN